MDYSYIIISQFLSDVQLVWIQDFSSRLVDTSTPRVGIDTRSIFKQSTTGLNSEFSFS